MDLRQQNLPVAIPQRRLSGAAELVEIAKHAGNRLLHLTIRRLLAAIVVGAHFPHGMTALYFLLERLTGTLTKQAAYGWNLSVSDEDILAELIAYIQLV